MPFSIGSKVWFRGKYSTQFFIRGKVEEVIETEFGWRGLSLKGPVTVEISTAAGEKDTVQISKDQILPLYGVRLENGNFYWVPAERLKEMGEKTTSGF